MVGIVLVEDLPCGTVKVGDEDIEGCGGEVGCMRVTACSVSVCIGEEGSWHRSCCYCEDSACVCVFVYMCVFVCVCAHEFRSTLQVFWLPYGWMGVIIYE